MPFVRRHVGPGDAQVAHMLNALGFADLDALIQDAVPDVIRMEKALDLPPAASEVEVVDELRDIGTRNEPMVQMIGLGYYDTFTPAVIQRRVLENPGWYTAYTPYQPEISQGRLEALLNFQTMIEDLTGLPTANASLLDEATAVAEAMTMAMRAARGSRTLVVDRDVFPQTLAVLATRAKPLGITIDVRDLSAEPLPDDLAGVVIQYPAASGVVRDPRPVIEAAHERGATAIVVADLLALALLQPPGEMGADVVVGTTQRFGVPLGFGGPHAGYICVRSGLERQLPGRLVGVSIDADGAPAYRLALQTREQHIRREKATSNICTAQVLLAVMASMYAVYHGPDGLKGIAQRTHRMAALLAAGLQRTGIEIVHPDFFDTIHVRVPGRADAVIAAARQAGVNLRRVDDDTVGISTDEVTLRSDIMHVWGAFGVDFIDVDELDGELLTGDWFRLPTTLRRSSRYLTHPVFHSYRSETEMLRYLRRLQDKDIALDRAMIPLGSCTMKLNATTEMAAISWPEFANIHPFAPIEQASGYLELIEQLEQWLVSITGYDRVSLQPNAGSQGEFAGLLAIRAYHQANGQGERDVCLVPASAHGTNAASAVMAGMRVVVIVTDDEGHLELDDLKAKIEQHHEQLAALMITYPSTHGVYESEVSDVCALVHDAGGQVYVDGANLNALVGLAQPGRFGADVSHLNLHKTFCIPHGGGGPGIGPIGVREHLAAYLPNHPMVPQAGPETGVGPITAAPWGSAGILPISWAYIRLMGPDGLTQATKTAVLSANYLAHRLKDYFPVLYTGDTGLVAHECILDLRELTKQTGVTVDDVAKRLIDYGFHAPTMSFPVAGTLMVEPTESEGLREIDRFVDAMIAIRGEIDRVVAGEWPVEDSPLRHAPHTATSLLDSWDRSYSRQEAAYPVPSLHLDKYWPPVRRIDGAYGDRNLVCSCPPPEAFAE
ncbi:MAG TPA: aminomethyl-transferring glycine dehydrogenase [Actinomycetes bacterium]|nr:aminomethyl-transferring glycine dehydrogenase [Actinomycetes bacterium]